MQVKLRCQRGNRNLQSTFLIPSTRFEDICLTLSSVLRQYKYINLDFRSAAQHDPQLQKLLLQALPRLLKFSGGADTQGIRPASLGRETAQSLIPSIRCNLPEEDKRLVELWELVADMYQRSFAARGSKSYSGPNELWRIKTAREFYSITREWALRLYEAPTNAIPTEDKPALVRIIASLSCKPGNTELPARTSTQLHVRSSSPLKGYPKEDNQPENPVMYMKLMRFYFEDSDLDHTGIEQHYLILYTEVLRVEARRKGKAAEKDIWDLADAEVLSVLSDTENQTA
ncbi:MAG: hypothetical protein Q9213_000494 [Squamulea squamosa]